MRANLEWSGVEWSGVGCGIFSREWGLWMGFEEVERGGGWSRIEGGW